MKFHLLPAILTLTLTAQDRLITTLAGSNPGLPPNAPALTTPLAPSQWGKPAIDAAGNIYFSLTAKHVVLKLTPSGTLEKFAGNGFARFAGDDGPANQASLRFPRDIAIDSRGTIYIADSGNGRIRRVLPNGRIDTFAGGGRLTPTATGTPRTDAALPLPLAVAADAADNIYFTIDQYSIARVDYNAAQLRLFAGAVKSPGTPSAGPALQSRFITISSLAADRANNLLIADLTLVRISPTGLAELLTGRNPVDVAPGPSGDIFFVPENSPAVLRVTAAGAVETYAGNAEREGYTPDGTPRTRAFFANNFRLTAAPNGNLIVADFNNARIRRVSPTVVDTLAGADIPYSGEGGPATAAVFHAPNQVAVSRAGTVYFSDSAARAVFAIDTRGTFRRFAGNGVLNGTYTDNRPALEAPFGNPQGIAIDSAGTVYVADNDCSIRRIGTDGIMRLHAGFPNDCGIARPGSTLDEARFGRLRGISIDSANNIYVTDISGHRVWRIGADRVVRPIAGSGQSGAATSGNPALQSPLNTPTGVLAAANGSIYISDPGNQRVTTHNTHRTLTTIAGAVSQPTGLAADAQGNILVAAADGHRIVRLTTTALVPVAGSGAAGFSGDGGPATTAKLDGPTGVAVNTAGEVFIADRNNGRIRRVLAAPPAIAIPATPIVISATPGDLSQRGIIQLPSPVSGLAFEASVRYATPNASWLTFTPTRGTLPTNIAYETNLAGLAAGEYTAQIVINVPNATPSTTAIPVTIKVPTPPTRSFLTVGAPRLTMAALRGESAQQTIPVQNPGATPIVVRSSVIRGPFLTVTPAELTIPPGQTLTFTVTANAGTQSPGTYFGVVGLAGGNSTSQVNVAFNISAAASRFVISQTALFFRSVIGGTTPRNQFIYATARAVSATATTVSGSPWLTAETAGNRVTVTVNPAGLAAGDHYGRIAITDFSTPPVRRFATVLLNVLPAGSDPGPELYPSALYYSAAAGGEVAGQDVEIVQPNGRAASFSASGATFEGAPWLEFAPANGAIGGATPGAVTVQPDVTALGPGVYRGNVTLTLNDGKSATVAILAVITPPGATPAKAGEDRAASGCNSPDLLAQVLAPAANFQATVGEPVRLAARVVDGCGNFHQPEGGGNAGVAVTGLGQQVISLTHIGNGVWEGTVTPNSIQPATLTFLGLFSRGTSFQAGAAKVNGAIVTAQRPVVFSDSLTDAASFQFGAPVGPGTLVSVFGENLNPAAALPSALPLPKRLGDVEVRLNDEPIPLLFAGPGQVNAQIPYSLNADGEYQLEIRRGNTITTPQPVVIAQARPGVFTVDQSGQGQGHVYRAMPDGSQVLAGPATPARPGETVIIYCNGLGATTPGVTAGEAAPFSPLAVTSSPVRVTMGGVDAAIAFAGLAPGFTGLYQINAVVPAGLPSGTVPLVLTVSGQESQPTQIN